MKQITKTLALLRYWISLCAILILSVFLVLAFTINDDFSTNEIIWIILAAVGVFFISVTAFFSYAIIQKKIQNSFRNIDNSLSMNNESFFEFARLGVMILDDKNEVVWINHYLDKYDFEKYLGQDVRLIDWQVAKLMDNFTQEITVNLNESIFSVQFLHQSRILLFREDNLYYQLLEQYDNEKTVIGIVNVDNYKNTVNIMSEELKVWINRLIWDSLISLTKNYNAFVKQYAEDGYVVVFGNEHFQKLREKSFQVLDVIRDQARERETEITLSVGFGIGTPDLVKLNSLAASAIDLAMSRGGDQVVVKSSGGRVQYYGGRSEARATRSKVAVRIFANKIDALIRKASNVVVCGHRFGDFDSLGSSLGISWYASNLGKPVKHVLNLDELDKKALNAAQSMISEDYFSETVTSGSEVVNFINEETLLIITDTNTFSRLDNPDLKKVIKKFVIIDHHRNSNKTDIASTHFMDPGASSASEIVTEILDHLQSNWKKVPSAIVNLLLAGIVLDTYQYRMRTSEATYDTSSLLKSWGADIGKVNNFLNDTMEEHLEKIVFFKNTIHVEKNIVILVGDADKKYYQSFFSQVAQSMILVSGVDAAFAVGRNTADQIVISGRSNGKVNVHVVCEKLGGGGHFTSSGAQFENSTIESVINQLEKVIKEINPEIKPFN